MLVVSFRMIRLNRALSVLSNISATSGMSSSLYRSRLHRRTNALSLSRSTAIQKPDQAEAQYSSLENFIHEKFYGDRPRGTPPFGGFTRKRNISIFDIWNAVFPKPCKIEGKLVLITGCAVAPAVLTATGFVNG